MKRFLFIAVSLGALLLLSHCKSKPKEPKDYIDVSSYLKGQLKYIDTVPFAFLKVLQQDSVYTDSQFITKEQVKAILQPFLVKEIEKKNFEENSKSTQSNFHSKHSNICRKLQNTAWVNSIFKRIQPQVKIFVKEVASSIRKCGSISNRKSATSVGNGEKILSTK